MSGALDLDGGYADRVAFIRSAPGKNLELLAAGGDGTFVKLSYLDAGGAERTGLAVSAGASDAIVSIGPDGAGSAHLDLENNDITGVIRVVISPDAGGGMLYAEGGALKWQGGSGTVTTLGPP